jgi:hypothetical protein
MIICWRFRKQTGFIKKNLKTGKFNELILPAAFRIRFSRGNDKNSDRISNRIDNLSQFLRAYEEADTAIRVGTVFCEENNVFFTENWEWED